MVMPILLYSIVTIVLQAEESDRMEAVENNARNLRLGIYEED